MAGHLDMSARLRHAFLAVALVGGTLAAVAGTSQAASADALDQIVVVDSGGAGSKDFGPSNTLKTLNTNGTKSFVAPVELPTADGGGQNAFGLSGGSNGNGTLSRSADGHYLSLAGYHHAPGNAGSPGLDPKDTTSAAIQRMVARVSDTGTVDTSTIFSNTTLSTSAPRAAVSVDGSAFYISGNGGSDSPKAGAFRVNLGGGSKVAVADTNQANIRQIQIAGGNLYATSDKKNLLGFGKFNTAGLPSSATALTQLAAITTSSAAPKPVSDLYVPDAMLILDTDGTPGIDTAYIAIQADAASGIAGEIRKYTTSNGTNWTQAGTATDVHTGDYPFLTGRVAGSKIELFATSGSGEGNKVVKFEDTNLSLSGAPSFSADTTIATAATGHAFRGVAFPPSSWNPGIVTSESPTISSSNNSVGGTLGDSHNPGVTLTVSDPDTDTSALEVTASSSNSSVIPNANISVNGTGADRTVSFDPTGVGRSSITFTVKDDNNNSSTALVSYGASAAVTTPAGGRYLYESSDLSSAIDVGDGYVLAGSSQDSTLRLYKQGESGRPVKQFALAGNLGGNGTDIESMARANDTLYIFGSHANKKDGSLDPGRGIAFSAAITGSGADTDVAFIASRSDLRDALKAWDVSHDNALGFAAGQAAGMDPKASDGFNIEGVELAPGSTTTAYIAFRSPVVGGKAIIVPWTNVGPLMGGTPSFGEAIKLDLGGRSIREIRKNGDDQYLISAQGDSASPEWKLFAWDGNPDNTPVSVAALPNPDGARTGAWESIVSVPSDLPAGKTVTLISDSGNTSFYGDSAQGSDEKKGLSKSFIAEFTTGSFTNYPDAPATVTATAGPGSIDVGWDAVSGATSYVVKVKTGTTETSATADASATSKTISGLSSASTYSTSVSAVNGSGTSQATAGPDVTPQDAPFDPPSDLSSPSHTSTSVNLAWTKVPGATGYILSQGQGADPRTTQTVGDVSSASFTGLSAGTAYSYDIVAVKGATQSAASSTITVTTSAAPSDRPSDVHWTSRTSSAVTIAWTKKSGSAKYKIRYFPEGTKTYKYLTVGNVSSAEVTGLSRGKSYVFKVAAISSSGTVSPYSTPNLIASTSNLLKPTNFVKTSRTATTITLTWTKAAGAEGYRVAHGIGTGARTYVDVGGGDTQTVTITGLTANKQYTIAIASTELSGTSRSSYTPRISVTTAAS